VVVIAVVTTPETENSLATLVNNSTQANKQARAPVTFFLIVRKNSIGDFFHIVINNLLTEKGEERMFKYMLCILILVLCLTHGARSALTCSADSDCQTNGDPFATCVDDACVCSSSEFVGPVCQRQSSIWLWILLGVGVIVVIVFLVLFAFGACYLYSRSHDDDDGYMASMDARGRYRRRYRRPYYPRDEVLLGSTRQ